MKKKQTILAVAAVLLVLAFAFWYGGDAPGLQGWSPSGSAPQSPSSAPSSSHTSASLSGPDSAPEEGEAGEESTPAAPESSSDAREPEDEAQGQGTPTQEAPTQDAPGQDTPVQPEQTPPPAASQPDPEVPSSSQAAQPEDQAQTCRISIVCSTVLDHLDWLAEGKADILPAGGIFLSAAEVEPEEGETAFSLLQRVTREKGIPMEASFTPGTGSAYVEGIGNLYEFDCGQRSGWLYFVNGISPGYSASEYTLKPGDRVEWVYTCDMGQDVGATVAGG